MVVVAGRVLLPGAEQRVVVHHRPNLSQPVGIGSEGALLVVGQSVESHILAFTAAAGRGEGIGLRGLHGNLSPLGGLKR